MSDGLTVPFALAAGLSGSLQRAHVVVIAGLAEIAAGSIAMGLGGYLAARSDVEHYRAELAREEREVLEKPQAEEMEVEQILSDYGLTARQIDPVLEHFRKDKKAWVSWMMRFELGLEEPDPTRALRSALTIAGSYICGGLIPLSPYMIWDDPMQSLLWSAVATLAALAVFGYLKGHFTGTAPLPSAVRTVLIGGLAATAAYLIAKAIS